ncbi:MAG: 4-hydroxy-tetrahydrodipicolinate reductase [Bacillota bacterium]
MNLINVIVSGAAGKMGREIVKAIVHTSDLKLVGVADLVNVDQDAGLLSGTKPVGLAVTSDLKQLLANSGAAVMIDFTSPLTVMDNIYASLEHRVSPVVGTTGISEENLTEIRRWTRLYNTGAIIAPNYALGAILMNKIAQLCARYMHAVEIIELHHDEKLDAPSGTAIKTANLISEAVNTLPPQCVTLETIPGVRGGRVSNIPIHSIRLPGLVAHQEVLFGGEGQILTIRHDAFSRTCFIPGLLMAVRHAPSNKELIYGMENLLE